MESDHVRMRPPRAYSALCGAAHMLGFWFQAALDAEAQLERWELQMSPWKVRAPLSETARRAAALGSGVASSAVSAGGSAAVWEGCGVPGCEDPRGRTLSEAVLSWVGGQRPGVAVAGRYARALRGGTRR